VSSSLAIRPYRSACRTFGPMDRQAPSRNVRNPANIIARAAVGEGVMTAVNPDVPGDCTYAPDVARAVRLLLEAPRARCLQHRLRRPGLVREYCSPMRAKWRQGLPSRSRRRQTSSSTRIEAPKHGAPMISPARRGISDGGRGPSPWPTISSGSASKRNQGNEIQVNGRAHLGLKRHRWCPGRRVFGAV
jgi:hypothetical protein